MADSIIQDKILLCMVNGFSRLFTCKATNILLNIPQLGQWAVAPD